MDKPLNELDYWELMPAQCDTGCGNFVLSDGCPKALENNELLCAYCCECYSHPEDPTSDWIERITE